MSDHEPDFDEGDFSEDDAEGDEHERELGYTSEGGFTTGNLEMCCIWLPDMHVRDCHCSKLLS